MNRPAKGVIELRTYYTWMDDSGIAKTVVKANSSIVIDDAIANSKVVNSLEGEHKFPLLVDSRKIKSITKEARDFYTIKDRETRVTAFAILCSSSVSKVIANFFIGINKPAVPVRLFTDESKAIDWCKKMKEGNV